MLDKIKSFFSSLKYFGLKNRLIYFCENKSIYDKIIIKEINFAKKNNFNFKNILIISYKNNLDFIEDKDIIKINFKDEFSLRLFLTNLKNSIIISTTPSFNKKISNKSNKFYYTHHSLGLLTNNYVGNYLKDFDFICVNNQDQFDQLLKLELVDTKKILKERYYDLDLIFNDLKNNNKNKKINKTILIASSFYGNSIIDNLDLSFLKKLSENFYIIFRPHPESIKNESHLNKLKKIENLNLKNLTVSFNDTKSDISKSDLLITDYSGITLSFAYIKKIRSLNLIKNKSDLDVLKKNIQLETLEKISEINLYDYDKLLLDLNKIENSSNEQMIKLINNQFEAFRKKINYQDIITS